MASAEPLLSVQEARARVLAAAVPLPAERLPIESCLCSALAQDLVADRPLPAFDNSEVDGYAVRASDLAGALPDRPVSLPVAFELAAGEGAVRRLEAGRAARVFTGAPLPPGADAVVMQERVRREAGRAIFETACEAGLGVRRAGEDVAAGARALEAGSTVGPAEIALALALGSTDLSVHRRPSVAIVTTGDELFDPGEALPPGGIFDSNGPALAAAVRAAGVTILGRHRAKDDPAALWAALERCRGADLVLTVAGVSVGERDYVRAALEGLGASLDFWRVAMRPGKPLALGRWGRVPILCLPGNPVSCLVTFELFGRPLVRRLAGHREVERPLVDAELSAAVRKPADLAFFCRGRWEDGRFTPAPKQGSGILTSLVGQNGLAEIPPGPSELPAGSRVRVRLLGVPELS